MRQVVATQFGGPDGEEAFFTRSLAQLPALHNFIA